MPGYGAVGWVGEGFWRGCCCVACGEDDGFCIFGVGHSGLGKWVCVGFLRCGCHDVDGDCVYILRLGLCPTYKCTKVTAGKCLLKAEGFPRMQAIACQLLDSVVRQTIFCGLCLIPLMVL